jgi:hypothetical protein
MKLTMIIVGALAVTAGGVSAAESDYFLRAKQAISEGMRDPDSVKFGKLFEGRGSSGKQTICGEVNAKNGFGGYTGMTPFIYFVDTDQATRVDIQNAKQITDPKILEMMIIGFLAYRVDCRPSGQ